ncbi:hypothetical protein Nepgr_014726 [Nepenthes gracilis]|uniref:Uncharacterized protein n=1 Tax=Nepenthes gracilis TaxID=150966 RepID=A0AAD3XQS2_NEPGR|nr:hypothetical protein Nepgr_014726 [Nepenthes gracilis]
MGGSAATGLFQLFVGVGQLCCFGRQLGRFWLALYLLLFLGPEFTFYPVIAEHDMCSGWSLTGFRLNAVVDWPSQIECCWDLVAALRLADDLAFDFAVLGTSWPILLGVHGPELDRQCSLAVAEYPAAGCLLTAVTQRSSAVHLLNFGTCCSCFRGSKAALVAGVAPTGPITIADNAVYKLQCPTGLLKLGSINWRCLDDSRWTLAEVGLSVDVALINEGVWRLISPSLGELVDVPSGGRLYAANIAADFCS